MNTQNSSTPLWLDLKTEYIDDNFEKLLPYLKCNCGKSAADSFLVQTIDLLARRVDGIIHEVGSRELFRDEAEMKDLRCKNVRILAAFCLARPEADNMRAVVTALLSELKAVTVKFASSLMTRMMVCLKHKFIYSIGIGWDDIINFHREIFASKLLDYMKLSDELIEPMVFGGKGTLVANASGLYITGDNVKDALVRVESGSESMETGIGLSVRTKSDDKLKKSDNESVDMTTVFIEDVIERQKRVDNSAAPVSKRHYANGDEIIVEVTEIDRNNVIHVVTTDEKYEKIKGTIIFDRPSIMYYYADTLYKNIWPRDFLKVTVNNALKGTFTLTKQLIEFMVEDCRENFDYGETLCKLIDVNVKKNLLAWITCQGVALYTSNSLALTEKRDGMFAYIDIIDYGKGKAYGKIDGAFNRYADPENIDDCFDEAEVRKDCIRAFAGSTEKPVAEKTKTIGRIDADIVRVLIRALFASQRTLLRPIEKIRYMGAAWMLAVMMGEDVTESYLRFTATYLRLLVSFVDNDVVGNVNLQADEAYSEEDSVRVRLGVIQILAMYGSNSYSEYLADCVSTFQERYPIISKLARLVQTANTMRDTFSKATINVIKREIVHTLSLETEDDADFETNSGEYLGVESGTVEFKTSFVFPAGNNMQPDLEKQKFNVCRGLCAFLNSETGGTLYLGVNDQGHVTGLDNDMRKLGQKSVDSYQRFVQDQALQLLGLDSMAYIRMEPLYSERVIALHVSPHPYRVVEIDGKAYVRINAESREMPENMKIELTAKRQLHDKEKAATISQLQHAISTRKVVVLHDYASNHSKSVQNRTVEAFDLRTDAGLVSCFDLNKNAIRNFFIDRIGYVELTDKDWCHMAEHRKMLVDAFHFTGDEPIEVSLELDLMSRNLLIEEFPLAKDDVVQDKKSPDVWYFNTKVFRMEGIGRFYIGLANHIKILHCPELVEYVKEYKEKFLDLK